MLAPSLAPILTAGGWEGSHSSGRQIWSQADSDYEQAHLGNYALGAQWATFLWLADIPMLLFL